MTHCRAYKKHSEEIALLPFDWELMVQIFWAHLIIKSYLVFKAEYPR